VSFLSKLAGTASQRAFIVHTIRKIYRVQNGKLYKCLKCPKPFSVKGGTMLEDSALPLQKWFFATYVMGAHKKGISSCQLAGDLEVTQKTAWHMLHRIPLAMKSKSFNEALGGTIECNESYVGRKIRGGGRWL